MKKLIFLFLILAFHFGRAQAPDPNFNDKAAFNDRLVYQKSAGYAESADYSSTDVIYQRLNFTVDPAVNYISGSVFSSVKFLKDDVAQVLFDLNDVMIVDSVQYNQKKIVFEHSANKVSVVLLSLAVKNSIGSVGIFYHGAPRQNGMGSFVSSTHNNNPIIWTLSEPYGAKDWWPCKESLSDKIDSVDVYITCPQQYKAASNGKLVEDKVSGQNRTAHWSHRYPIATYLVGIAVTNYETYSDFLDLANGEKIEVLNYVYPEYLTTAKSKSADILNILSFYNRKFMTYPFASEKYGHAQFGWGGGMEHQTMSFMTNLDFELVAHEMAHQWFGDYITLASWYDIWLNEGFATYLTGLTYENLLNGQYWQNWKNIQVSRITSSPDGSVYVADTTDVNRIFNGRLSYSKGAYLLHMLRWEIGDSLFFKGLKNYLKDPEIANGFASQEKFVAHMEAVADTSFTEFFKDWYYGEGYPIYRLTYYTDYGDSGKQKLRISQSSSNSSVGFFEMHIPVRIWKDGTYSDLRLYNTSQNQEFVISDTKVDRIEFDPDKWLIAKSDLVDAVLHVSEIADIQIIPENESKSIRILLPENSGKGKIRIVDLSGRIVKNCELFGTDTKIATSDLRSGFYLVEVKSGKLGKTEKVLLSPRQAE
ncbi:lysyl aminopeptidase [Aquipluma nitroreducens]|uniref:Aminopeptidase N n=1 Tax=Aquipluma nitroreducens TaxID=2010828 RepID=A0A5K7S849_9BACT|nr:M1 family aminopeptidase [Aquipluma nitroreducens]BBE17741.1 lysyl aminopeptidase [Aquipluma nitroreducens]